MAKVEDFLRANGANKQERELETPKKTRAVQERKCNLSVVFDSAVNGICTIKMPSTGF